METKQNEGLTGRFLCLSIGNEEFGLPLTSVREVIALPQVRPIPFSPPHFLGIINLRDKIIPIIDLRIKFKFKAVNSSETTVIICDFEDYCIGAVIDSVNSVITAESADTSELPQVSDNKLSDFITGVYKTENRLVLLMNLAKALNGEDRQSIAKAMKAPKAA
jgi:purine-binding chemotaxis protein CheW